MMGTTEHISRGEVTMRHAAAPYTSSDLPPLADEAMAQIRRIYNEKILPLVHNRW